MASFVLGEGLIFNSFLHTFRPVDRSSDDLEVIYEELLHIKALSHLSTMVKRELASVLMYEQHPHAGTVLFNQGESGKSWYIILKGSVDVLIFGKVRFVTLNFLFFSVTPSTSTAIAVVFYLVQFLRPIRSTQVPC